MTVISRTLVVAPPLTRSQQRLCLCGHQYEAHEHHRPGTDCSGCGPSSCGRFRRASRLRRLLD
jgi:hypothetical protein